MKASIWVMIVIVIFLIIGSVLVSTGIDTEIFTNKLFVLLLAVFSIMILICSYRQKFTWKKLGFQMCHLGVVTILLGACLGYFFSVKTQFSVPIDATKSYGQIQKEDGSSINLGFGVGISDFKVTRYDPDYVLFKVLGKNEKSSSSEEDYQFIRDVKKQLNGTYDAGEYGKFEVSELKDSKTADGWREQYELKNGMILIKKSATDKHYLAKMDITDLEGRMFQKDLQVNHPVNHKSWRFYLMSYDREQGTYVVLDARKDPGRLFVIFGIWATILGTAILCFNKSSNGRLQYEHS